MNLPEKFKELGFGVWPDSIGNFNGNFLMNKSEGMNHLRLNHAWNSKEGSGWRSVILIREIDGNWLKPECVVGTYNNYFELMDAIRSTRPSWVDDMSKPNEINPCTKSINGDERNE